MTTLTYVLMDNFCPYLLYDLPNFLTFTACDFIVKIKNQLEPKMLFVYQMQITFLGETEFF